MDWNKTLLVIAAIGAVLFALWYFFVREAEIVNYPSSGRDIIAFGDSIMAGVGASEGKGFVDLLSQRIGEPIINLSVSGNTTADGLARLDQLDAYDPKIVLLLLGGNDRLRNVPSGEVFKNLATIIENIQARGAVVILLGIRGGILSDPYEAEYKELSERYGTAYVPDVLRGLFGEPEFMADQIHPNSAGHARIADRVYPVLERLLK